jgi:hypothetical protein
MYIGVIFTVTTFHFTVFAVRVSRIITITGLNGIWLRSNMDTERCMTVYRYYFANLKDGDGTYPFSSIWEMQTKPHDYYYWLRRYLTNKGKGISNE